MMKLVVLIVVVSAGCTVNKRSADFECSSNAECRSSLGDGFTCVQGICLSTSPPPNDGNPDPDMTPKPDAAVCPAQCTSCRLAEKVCKVDCGASPPTCNSPINCPEGFNCEIICSTPNGCGSINCTNGESCLIDCKASGTCKSVTCGAGPCEVKCDGGSSCSRVDCQSSCACDVDCNAIGSCAIELTCPGTAPACNTLNPRGCTSERDGCNTCQ